MKYRKYVYPLKDVHNSVIIGAAANLMSSFKEEFFAMGFKEEELNCESANAIFNVVKCLLEKDNKKSNLTATKYKQVNNVCEDFINNKCDGQSLLSQLTKIKRGLKQVNSLVRNFKIEFFIRVEKIDNILKNVDDLHAIRGNYYNTFLITPTSTYLINYSGQQLNQFKIYTLGENLELDKKINELKVLTDDCNNIETLSK